MSEEQEVINIEEVVSEKKLSKNELLQQIEAERNIEKHQCLAEINGVLEKYNLILDCQIVMTKNGNFPTVFLSEKEN
jgi:hypothetical protein